MARRFEMKYRRFSLFVLAVLILEMMTACRSAVAGVPTATATATPVPASPTNTSTPTLTPKPTLTPNVIKTQNYDDLFSEVQRFKDEGLIPDTRGTYNVLEDFVINLAKIGWLQYHYYDFKAKHFVYKAHVSWKTAAETNEVSGCGIVFGINEKEEANEYYGMVLDKSRIYFSYASKGHYHELGKTRGTGTLNFGNPAEADLTLLVYDYKAYVYVNEEFIGEYTLKSDQELNGKFGYGVISGTNRDYGTRCEITNSKMWKLSK
jgi:hypothetical protein